MIPEVIPACAGVILRSGMVLLARRGPGQRQEGKWEFPGGRIEAGESPQQALVRELREELGIEAEVGAEAGRNRHAYTHAVVDLIFYFVPRFTGEPKLSVHDKLAWVQASKLLEYDILAADLPVARLVAAHRRRERYTGTHPKGFAEKYKELRGDAAEAEKAKERGSTPAGSHLPIMLEETLSALAPLSGASILDCTVGWGGHAEALARGGAKVLGLDRDGEELARTQARLTGQGLALSFRKSDFAEAASAGFGPFDGLLADLGVSSMQLDRPERGMSFKRDGPLDMRMDRSQGPTAAEWLAKVDEKTLAALLSAYGDEPDASAVAAALKRVVPKTTKELAERVAFAKGLGPEALKKKDAFSYHPAARTFQALRIALNGERDSLRRLLAGLPGLLRSGGRAVFLTFHSGEEKLVREALEGSGAFKLDAPLKPSPSETRANPRSRSARLWRAVRKGTDT